MKPRLLMIVLPAAALAAGVPQPVSAADACISPKALEALSSCPGGATKGGPLGRGPIRLPPTRTASPRGAARPPPPDPGPTARQIRRNLASTRTVPLIVAEIRGLEGLLGQTPASAPERPKLLRRTADSYAELEAIAFSQKIQARVAADEARRKDPKAAAARDAEARKSEEMEIAARKAAIKSYGELRAKHPGHCEKVDPRDPTKRSGCIDEVLYDLAYEHEQAGQLGEARKTYLALIQNHPTSKHVPRAYLAFGELFFGEAQSDPARWELAEQSYKEVTKFPAPENTSLGYAHYKLGYVYWNKGEHAQALSSFKRTIELENQFPSIPGVKQLAASARRDLIPLYALAGDPRKAHAFLRPLSGDNGAETARTFKMLDDLGQSYLDIGRYQEAIDLYEDLASRDKGPNLCGYRARIATAVLAQKSGDKAAIKAAIDRQLETEAEFRASAYPAAAKLSCSSATAELAVETAMAWHLEAIGSGGVRGTGDKKTKELAGALYEAVTARFSADDWSKLQFPRIVKEDRPTLLKVRYAMADLLYDQKAWAKCGPAFDAVAREQPDGPLARESLYTAAICYQNVVNALPPPVRVTLNRDTPPARDAVFEPRELSATEQAMVGSFNRFLCGSPPAQADTEGRDRWVDVKYARARTYFEARRWEEAAAAFRDIAVSHPDHEAGIFAVQLYLESLNVLATRRSPPRVSCLDDMERDTPKLAELYCRDGKRKDLAEQCAVLARVERDVLVYRAGLLTTGEGTDAAARERLERGANLYYSIWTRFGVAPCQARKPECERMDEALHNAARAYQAARLLARAISVRKVLIDPTYNLEKTDLGRRALYDLGANYQAIAVYDEAAGYFERFARESPKAAKAAEALQDAIVLRLGLGQEEQAMKDAELFERDHGKTHSAAAAKIAFAIAVHAIEGAD